jgi:Mrp family chromosome partitioning ATPase
MSTLTGTAPSAGSRTSYLAGLRRYFWIPILCAVAAAGLGYVLDKQIKHQYSARALLKIDDQNLTRSLLGLPAQNNNDQAAAAIELIPEVDQASTASRAIKILGKDGTGYTVKKVQDDTDVALDKDTGLVAVQAQANSARISAALANAYAEAYVDRRSERDLAQIEAAIRSLDRQLQKVRRTAKINPADASTAAQLAVRLQTLRLYQQTRPKSISIATPAVQPTGTSGISPKRAAIYAAVLGLLLGLAIVAVREQTDRRTRTPEDFEIYFGAPVLARIPRSRRLHRRRPFRELTAAEGEAFRVLLARLRNHRMSDDARSVMVTSSSAREGKSTSSWYLASAAALSGIRTLVLEVDRARPSGLPSTMGGDGTGVREILAGEREPADTIRHFPVEGEQGFDVIQAGRSLATVHLGRSEGVDDLMRWAEDNYELVIVEAPPLTIAADAVPFARRASTLVAVCRNGLATPETCARLKTIIDGLDTPIAGVVAVGYDSANYYYY